MFIQPSLQFFVQVIQPLYVRRFCASNYQRINGVVSVVNALSPTFDNKFVVFGLEIITVE
jgi:hypothetical protein